jgi:U3 small nucleolar RNA-associated protein MPP10
VSESIEELIKRRILANEFDDVLRRRPDSESVAADTRRGLVDVDDTKSKKGLAEIYEEEHVKNANPDTYISKADEKLRKEEQEVEQMWRDVCAKLDALSSWHYKPKPSAPAITVVSDVATVAMEDAQPATAQGVAGGESMIAPQEVYRAGATKDAVEQGEVVSKAGLPVARQEMTREEKLRRRRREKERKRKAGATGLANGAAKREAGARVSRKDTIADLRKGGVRVINRKGEILDVDGNKPKAAKVVTSGGFKL